MGRQRDLRASTSQSKGNLALKLHAPPRGLKLMQAKHACTSPAQHPHQIWLRCAEAPDTLSQLHASTMRPSASELLTHPCSAHVLVSHSSGAHRHTSHHAWALKPAV